MGYGGPIQKVVNYIDFTECCTQRGGKTFLCPSGINWKNCKAFQFEINETTEKISKASDDKIKIAEQKERI